MRLPPGLPPEVDDVLRRFASRLERVLGPELSALYLFGSAVTRDFVPGVSDVDLVAVLGEGAHIGARLRELNELHARIVEETPEWDDRLEVVYLSRAALVAFREGVHPAARISPGEPFHEIQVDATWVLDWYRVREHGVAIVGPPPAAVVPAIDATEYVEAARHHVLRWPLTLDAMPSRRSQVYAILTACRASRTVELGEPGSKREAAAWAIERLPHLAGSIDAALEWHERSGRESDADGGSTFETTADVIREIQRRVAAD